MPQVSIGFFGKPHGVRGYLSFYPSGDTLEFINFPFLVVFKKKDKPNQNLEILSGRKASKFYILSIKGLSNPDSAKQYTGGELFCDSELLEKIPLKKNEILVKDLVGLEAVDTKTANKLGYIITDVKDLSVHSILVFQNQEKNEILVPFISEYVGDWDLPNKSIQVKRWEDWFAV